MSSPDKSMASNGLASSQVETVDFSGKGLKLDTEADGIRLYLHLIKKY